MRPDDDDPDDPIEEPGWETVLDRLDRAVTDLLAQPVAAQATGRASWDDLVQDFASQAGRLELLLGKAAATISAQTSSKIDDKSIALLEAELASKDRLLIHADQQVKKWQQVCVELQQKHEGTLFAGIS